MITKDELITRRAQDIVDGAKGYGLSLSEQDERMFRAGIEGVLRALLSQLEEVDGVTMVFGRPE